MIVIKSVLVLVVVITLATKRITAADDLQHPGMRAFTRVYDECQKSEGGFVLCFKKKAVTFLDRIGRIDSINVSDGLKLTRSEGYPVDVARTISETDLEASLPRGLEARDEALTNMLLERVAKFFSGRTVQVQLPKVTPEEIGRGVEEGGWFFVVVTIRY